ncbi:MAG: imidazole glycerol phosphate synthase subunit HisH [Acidobacteria bacterium]|nr:imidazole glycerol phosphate synthase subunit HisH [Acidobacteriota bacterium]MCB9398043.1 imidazole glycerol phosphate synthase subunit HisH [Acidobacteriota bacterium]
MGVAIIHPGSGNITSLGDALARLGQPFSVVKTPQDVSADVLFLPGQGRFGTVAQFLWDQGWQPFLQDWLAQGKRLVGICVGMQVLFEGSEEDPTVPGLGFFTGILEKLSGITPMMGWAQVEWLQAGWPKGAGYFVNSFVMRQSAFALGRTQYDRTFCSAVQKESCLAFQFHPEKSGAFGAEVLKKCLD